MSAQADASTFSFNTGNPDGAIGSPSRPTDGGKFEIETGDDFILASKTSLTSASLTGIIPEGAVITDVILEIYRVFPKDSDPGRTSGDPVFGTPQVPTRVNSPSDVAFVDPSVGEGDLTFTTTDLGAFTASNSIQPGGINAIPDQTTGGDGPISGREVRIDLSFGSEFVLPADHYFFVPQVALAGPDGDFFWLSAPKPIVAPGTPFDPDLQGWTRDEFLSPDWLRIGTDIVGAGAFNFAFSLDGETVAAVPLPAGFPVLASGLIALGLAGWRRKARS